MHRERERLTLKDAICSFISSAIGPTEVGEARLYGPLQSQSRTGLIIGQSFKWWRWHQQPEIGLLYLVSRGWQWERPGLRHNDRLWNDRGTNQPTGVNWAQKRSSGDSRCRFKQGRKGLEWIKWKDEEFKSCTGQLLRTESLFMDIKTVVLFISRLWPELYCSIFLYSSTVNYIHFLPLAWTLHLSSVYSCSASSSPPLLCPVSPPRPAPSSFSLSPPKPHACTRAADKDTNTNWQPLGQARMIETVSVAGGRNSSKRTNTVLLLPT